MQSSFFDLNLLKAQRVSLIIKVTKRRTLPLLVGLCVFLFQSRDVLCHLLQHFRLELTLRLARAHLRLEAVGAILRGGDLPIGKSAIQLAFLCGWWRFQRVMRVGTVRQDPLLRI